MRSNATQHAGITSKAIIYNGSYIYFYPDTPDQNQIKSNTFLQRIRQSMLPHNMYPFQTFAIMAANKTGAY